MAETIEIRDSFGELLKRHAVASGATGLRGAVMQGAELTGAQLAGTDMEGIDLYWGILFWANLEAANLKGANLQGADLNRANLVNANLAGANLGRDNLGGSTSLEGANLTGANLRGALFGGATYNEETRFPAGFNPEKAGMLETDTAWPPHSRGWCLLQHLSVLLAPQPATAAALTLHFVEGNISPSTNPPEAT